MSTRNEPADWAKATGEAARELAGKIRRMAVTLTTQAFWQVAGYILLDGSQETRDVETFNGVGFFARPPTTTRPEAIVVFVGGARNPIIIACRDEDTRKSIAADLQADESQMHNSLTMIRIYQDGRVEVRQPGGVAGQLATKADIDALKTWILTHAHTGVTTGVGVSGPPSTVAPDAVGTQILKAQ